MEEVAPRPPKLDVIWRRALRRVGVRVAETGSSRMLATCADPELRAEALEALRGHPGVDDVVEVAVGTGRDWWAPLLTRRELDGPRPHTLYCLTGLPRHAGRSDAEIDFYRELNQARELVSTTGTHLLVWLDGVRELAEFVVRAPDWWSRRQELVALVTEQDFSGEAQVKAEVAEDWDGRFEEVERRRGKRDLFAEVTTLTELARIRWEQGRYADVAPLLDEAERLIPTPVPFWMERASLMILVRRLELDTALGRIWSARERAVAALDRTDGAGASRGILSNELASAENQLRFRASAREHQREAVRSAKQGDFANSAVFRYHLGDYLREAGLLREASTELSKIPPSSAVEDRPLMAFIADSRALIARAGGDADAALEAHAEALRHLTGTGAERVVATVQENLAALTWDLGHATSALAAFDRAIASLRRQHNPNLLGWSLLRKGDRLATLPARESEARATYEEAAAAFGGLADSALETVSRADGLSSVHRKLADLPGSDRDAHCALALAALDAAAPHVADDPEQRGRLTWERALVGLTAGDVLLTETQAALARNWGLQALAWARQWRGPALQAELHGLLAQIAAKAGDWSLTLEEADAMRVLAEPESVYLSRDAWSWRAIALTGASDHSGALDAWTQGRAVLTAEGLRVAEVELLLQMLDPLDDRLAPVNDLALAHEALALAQQIQHPRPEGRAWLVLARLAPTPAEARHPFDEAAELLTALGPPPQLDALRALARQHGFPVP